MKIFGIAFLALAILPAPQPSLNPPSHPPVPTGCLLVAKTDLWMNVYQEDDQGNRGAVLFADTQLKEGENQRVTGVRNDRIIYNTRVETTDPYGPDVHAACADGARVYIP